VNNLQAGQGSGLGLFISKGIVEQHGGTLEAYSAGQEKGTRFTVILPLYEVSADSTAKSSEDNSVGEAASVAITPMRILIVDDIASNRKLLGRLLKFRGHEIDNAEDGRVALTKIAVAEEQLKPYTTVLLDYEMPHLTGRK